MVEAEMGLGRGALLWILGVPLPIILLVLSRHCAQGARGAGERDGEAHGGGRGLSQGVEGNDAAN